MSASAPSPNAPEGATPSRRASAREFMLVGGATVIVLPLLLVLERSVGRDAVEYEVGFLAFYAAYLVNDPHFSVTYLLFYRKLGERSRGAGVSFAQRLRYLGAGFVAPALLLGWGGVAIALRSGVLMGLLLQLMFFLVSWHYVKQGFGVLVTLVARAGERFSSLERGLLLGHALSAWLFARASPFDPGTPFIEQGVFFRSLAHPPWLFPVTAALFGISALGGFFAVLSFGWRTGRFPPLAGISGYFGTIWFLVVFTNLSTSFFYVVPLLHSVQYLYFVWLQQSAEGRAFEGEPHFDKPVKTRLGVLLVSALGLAWLLFHGLPETLDELFARGRFDPNADLGPTPFLAAIFAFVNIHHYLMDAVIWRREVREARFLVPNGAPQTLRARNTHSAGVA